MRRKDSHNMSRFLFFFVVLSVVACSVAQQNVQVAPLEVDAGVPVNPALVAGDARPKRQFGLGFLLGSALGGYGHGYGHGYPGYGGYGYGHGHGRGHFHHHVFRRPNYGYYGGYGYGR